MSSRNGSRTRRSRADYERGLPGYHDPTAGYAGSTPGRSALTLRAWLAGFGLLSCAVGAVLLFLAGLVGLGVLLVVLAVVAAVDLGWVLFRKRRGEPG